MGHNLLILGGTTEASALARAVDAAGIPAVLSLAGRVALPARQAVPLRVGGFGGVDGLSEYVQANGISHVIDATHPFAARMSCNAVAASRQTGVKLAALIRAQWAQVAGDQWRNVADMAGAVEALDTPPQRVFLAIGRMNVADFAVRPQHHYVLRLVDPPKDSLPLPNAQALIARGPFDEAEDRVLLQRHRIGCVVSKNSGGSGAYAKIAAARALGLPVIMVDRPKLPARTEFHDVDAVMRWLGHVAT